MSDDILTIGDVFSAGVESVREYVGELIELEREHGRAAVIAVDAGGGEEDMTLGRLLASMILLSPYGLVSRAPSPERMVRDRLGMKQIVWHMNETIRELYDHVEAAELSTALAWVTKTLSSVAIETTTRVGTGIGVIDFLDAAYANPRIWELLHWETPRGISLDEMERETDLATGELIELLIAQPGNLSRLLRSGSSININQFRQLALAIGLKPGFGGGELISEPINTNYLRGLQGVRQFYYAAMGARKALATNFREVKDSGYLARKLSLLVMDHTVDRETEYCGTTNGLDVQVVSEEHARRLVGRYALLEGGDEPYRLTQEDLLGAVGSEGYIRILSPVTCAARNGVCHRCYGSTVKTNLDIHAGLFAVLVLSAQITQRLLSSKHLLRARPVKIKWKDPFLNHFFLDGAVVVAGGSVDSISIYVEDFEVVQEGIDGEDEATVSYKAVSRFEYYVGKEHYNVEIPVPVTLDPEAWAEAEVIEERVVIYPTPGLNVFHAPVLNTDLNEALHAVFNLIERNELTDVSDAYVRLIGHLMRSDLFASSVHAEMILRALVRDPEDLTRRPDFSGGTMPPYVILKLSGAIMNSAAITTSLAFERVRAQLTSSGVLKKDNVGMLDLIFGG